MLTKEYSVQPSGNTVKCIIISAALLAVLFTEQLFISIYQTPIKVEHAKEASKFQRKLWENRDLTVQPVICIYSVWLNLCKCLFFFSNHRSVMDQKLN
jgi:uncharacterized membrane protein